MRHDCPTLNLFGPALHQLLEYHCNQARTRIIRQNIERFRALAASTTNPNERERLLQRLAEEEAKLKEHNEKAGARTPTLDLRN
jgi:hypothetical protein